MQIIYHSHHTQVVKKFDINNILTTYSIYPLIKLMDKYDILVRQIKKEIKNNNGANINVLVLDAIENARKIDSRHGINEFFRIAGHEVKWPNREEIF